MTWDMALLVKTTVVLGAALAAVSLAATVRASRRHLILASAFAALVVLPVAATVMPVVGIPLRVVSAWSATPAVAPIAVAGTTPVQSAATGGAQGASTWSSPAPQTMLRGVWMLGGIAVAAALARSLWKIRGLRRSGVPWIAGEMVAKAIGDETGDHRPVTVILHERVAVPATIGFCRPTILLPPDAQQWTEIDLRRAFVHELEHVRRADWWVHVAARGICVLYWFHPLVWIAWRRLELEAERACDDAVVTAGDRAGYAEQLVALATRLSTPQQALMSSMANRSDLSVRVRAILNPTQRRGRAGAAATLIIIPTIAVVAGAIAPLGAVAIPRRPVNDRSAHQMTVATSLTPPASDQHVDDLILTAPAIAAATGVTLTRLRTLATTPPLPSDSAASPAQTPPASANAPTASRDYVIGAEDVLSIVFWESKEMSNDVVVRSDGKITVPLVNDIMAGGLTPEELRVTLVEAFEPFYSTPHITVIVKEINSKVFVQGAGIRNPGAYRLTGPMTVVRLIATAGGFTEFAKTAQIVILRQVDGKEVRFLFDYMAFVNGQNLAENKNILLERDDTVIVP